MEGADPYHAALAQALESKRAHLDSVTLPGLRDTFRLYLTTFEGLQSILLKKGLIREDPYKLEEKLSEIKVPSRERYASSDLNEQMGLRLSQFHSQLDFLINYYEFSVAHLSLARLKQITALARYIDFGNLAESSGNPNTAGAAVLVGNVAAGNDTVAVSIVKDGVQHLGELGRRILKAVADAALYQRERYKLDLRASVTAKLGLQPQSIAAGRDAALAAVRKGAQEAGLPYSPELAGEVLAEDYPADPAAGAQARASVLSRLKVEEKKQQKPKAQGPVPRELLLDAVRALTGTEGALRAALKIVRDNEELVARKPLTLMERIRQFFARAAGAKVKEKLYEIEYMEESRGSSKVERVVYETFLSEAAAKVRTLQLLGTRGSPTQQRLQGASEDQLFDLVSKLCGDTIRIVKRMEGLSALFRSQVSPAYRSQLHGVHGDLAIIRNAVIRANRQKHEYVARREEEEQFRKLGIAPQG